MTLDINPETERIAFEELRNGHFQSVDELILSGVQAWHELNLPKDQAAARDVAPAGCVNGREKAREFVKWVKSHPHTPPLSDDPLSRASLNPDRW